MKLGKLLCCKTEVAIAFHIFHPSIHYFNQRFVSLSYLPTNTMDCQVIAAFKSNTDFAAGIIAKPEIADAKNLGAWAPWIVQDISADSIFHGTALEKGMHLLAINNKELTNGQELLVEYSKAKMGDPICLLVRPATQAHQPRPRGLLTAGGKKPEGAGFGVKFAGFSDGSGKTVIKPKEGSIFMPLEGATVLKINNQDVKGKTPMDMAAMLGQPGSPDGMVTILAFREPAANITPAPQPVVKKVFKPLPPAVLKADLEKLLVKPAYLSKSAVPECDRGFYQFVVGFKYSSNNIFPMDKNKKTRPPTICTQAELEDMVKICEPLSKIIYVRISGLGFSTLRGLDKVPPVGQALLQKYPQFQFFIQPTCVQAMLNKRWEHFVTVELRR